MGYSPRDHKESDTTEHTQHRYLGDYCFAENYFLVLILEKMSTLTLQQIYDTF